LRALLLRGRIADLKGRHMLIDTYASLFDAVPTVVG
jgi:hypothetical protein